MSTQTLRILIAAALFLHGVGHTFGYFRPARSWILRSAGDRALRITANIVWTLAGLGFVLSFLAFLDVILPPDWWRPLAVTSAIVSLSGLILFMGDWPVFNTIGAFGFNVIVLVALLWLHWPPVEMFGW